VVTSARRFGTLVPDFVAGTSRALARVRATFARMTTTNRTDDGQLRLALIELGRIEREIRELERQPEPRADQPVLRSLRLCRATLIEMAHGRLALPRA
jgi:hypothetical protein